MKLISICLGMAVFAMVPGHAQTVLNFDSIDTSGGPVSGTELTNYFAGFGITISNVTGGTTVEAFPQNAQFIATSAPNMLTQSGSATGESFTLNFASPVVGVSLVRSEYDGANPPSPSGIAYPQWSVTAFNGATSLGSVGESLNSAFSDVPAQTFNLNYTGITSLVFEGNAEDVAGLGSPMIDNISFTPEPSTWAMLLGGMGLLAFWRVRSSRQALS